MKRTILAILAICFSYQFLIAKEVDPGTAGLVAKNFYLQKVPDALKTNFELTLIHTYSATLPDSDSGTTLNIPLIYIYNTTQTKGFIIVSGDDRVLPILGYSDEGLFDMGTVPPALQKLIEGYKNQILFAQEQDFSATTEIQKQWNSLKENEQFPQKSLSAVTPLLSTKWNQSPYYNDLCPYDYYYSELTVSGCVATAMAQIMKYWNYPSQGVGFHSYNCPDYGTQTANFASTNYNWAAMPNNVTSTNDAVATLMYHCGVSVDMGYGVASTGGSSAFIISSASPIVNCAEYAYKTYFGYDPNTILGLKRENYSDDTWKNLLKTDLNNGRPLQYAGFGSGGGHTFVCDGYDNSDFFHMNWGWGGLEDGYFNLDALNPGSTGTGGGTGGFNSGQQAVIGIVPISGGGNGPNIELYSSITVSPDPIDFYSAFTVNADFYNAGQSSFSGDYCAAIFDSDGIFIDYVQILTAASNPLPAGYHYTGGLTFTNDGLPTVPGTYIIGVYFRETGGEWILAESSTYYNPVSIDINSPYNPLEQYSEIVVTPSTLVQGQSASVNVNFYNSNSYTYYGQYSAALYDLDGNFVQTIGTYNETSGFPAGYVYAAPFISFNCTAITAQPGTYMLAILEKESGSSSSYFVGGSYFTTPINIVVVAPQITADAFEPNNTQASSKDLTLNWSNNIAQCYTSGSNMHIGTDYDFYKISLATGYNYVIKARAHDSYNSGNGQIYTNDVVWSYNKGAGWSEVYDDVMTGNIYVNGAGTVYYQVSPYFSGQTGTYLMDIKVTRSANTGLKELGVAVVKLYPNPEKDFLNVDFSDEIKFADWQIINSTGIVSMYGKSSQEKISIDISDLSDGVYSFNAIINDKHYSGKFIHLKK
jgi:hypothetical protein